MCPLRFILVFLSAALAAYFAWTTVRSSPESALPEDKSAAEDDESEAYNLSLRLKKGLCVFADMASGKYLWRNMKEVMKKL